MGKNRIWMLATLMFGTFFFKVKSVLAAPGDCSGVLGSFKGDLEGILKIIRIVGPLLVVVLSSYEYVSAIMSKDAEGLQKSNKRLIKRLILIAILFFLPTILNLFLSFYDSAYTTCIE